MRSPLEIYATNRSILEQYLSDWNLERSFVAMDLAYEDKDPKKLVRIANQAWFALPDCRAIRTHGFFPLCDIAECMFDDDREDEE